MANKVKGKEELLKIISELKKNRKKVVMVSGSFDLLHAGHIEQLQKFKKQGDILVVLLNSDKSVQAYKGPNRPIINEKNRAFTLSALDCIDYIFIFDELVPLKWIKSFKPDIYCNGSDWGKKILEHDTVVENGGKIFIGSRSKKDSTSGIIEKIINIEKTPDVKAIFYFDGKFAKQLKAYAKKYLTIKIENKKKLLDIAKQKNIALGRSFLISEKLEEIEVGKMHNCKTIFIGTLPKKVSSTQTPDLVVQNLLNKII